MTSYSRSKIILAVLLTATVAVYCSQDENIPLAPNVPLKIEIISGPANGSTVLNNAKFTFGWRTEGSSSPTFTVQLTGVDGSPVTTNDFSRSYPGQPEGSYTFTVTATATGGGATSSESRAFTVGGSLFNPSVTLSGPRGSASSGGSGVIPQYAPGDQVKFTWTGSDEDRFGSITGYSFRTTDAGSFSTSTLGTAATFDAPAIGTHTFTLVATDNAGGTTTVSLSYGVRTPEIMVVDDRDISSFLGELAEDDYFAGLFEGFSAEFVDVAANGFSGPNADTKVIVWHYQDSNEWSNVGDGTSTVIADFIDGGGKLWAMGEDILERVRFNSGEDATEHSNPPLATEFEAKYLHISTTDAWVRSVGDDGENFGFAVNALGDAAGYPKIGIDSRADTWDADAIGAGDGAEVVYAGTTGLDVPAGNVAVRFPSGGASLDVFFMSFSFYISGGNNVSPNDARTLVSTIMVAMGQ